MKKKLISLTAGVVVIAATIITKAALTPLPVTLSWDPPNPTEQVTGWIVYELQGTNFIRLTATATTNVVLSVVPGAHIYAVTATNFWGIESPFSNSVGTPPVASPAQGVRISR